MSIHHSSSPFSSSISPASSLLPSVTTPATDEPGLVEEITDSGESQRWWERLRETMADHHAVINTFIAGEDILTPLFELNAAHTWHAGGLAGATSRTVVSPFERLKIIL